MFFADSMRERDKFNLGHFSFCYIAMLATWNAICFGVSDRIVDSINSVVHEMAEAIRVVSAVCWRRIAIVARGRNDFVERLFGQVEVSADSFRPLFVEMPNVVSVCRSKFLSSVRRFSESSFVHPFSNQTSAALSSFFQNVSRCDKTFISAVATTPPIQSISFGSMNVLGGKYGQSAIPCADRTLGNRLFSLVASLATTTKSVFHSVGSTNDLSSAIANASPEVSAEAISVVKAEHCQRPESLSSEIDTLLSFFGYDLLRHGGLLESSLCLEP